MSGRWSTIGLLAAALLARPLARAARSLRGLVSRRAAELDEEGARADGARPRPMPAKRSCRRPLIALAIAMPLLAALGGFAVSASGLYSVSAAKGHWFVTRSLLTFSMSRSVARHAGDLQAPPLDHPALLHLGLAHYDGGCAPCHGAPGEPRNAIPIRLVPQPPFLPDTVHQWTAEELFWIVDNGLKYTGMPAWPARGREDEVWAVVAAQLALPELSPVEYRRIARGHRLSDLARVQDDARLLATAGPLGQDLLACARCHGLAGEGGGEGAFPALAGQSEDYLYRSLRDYAIGVRPSGVMQPVAVALGDDERRQLARFYAALPPVRPAPAHQEPAPAALVARGARLAQVGAPAQGVPACHACHGPAGWQRHPLYPALAGQSEFYLERQLQLWRSGQRSATPLAEVMRTAAEHLEDEQIVALAAYYSSLDPQQPVGAEEAGR